MSENYDFTEVEEKWRARWEREETHRVDLDHARRPFLNLMMFPYPSAEGLHVGNVFAFVGSDVQGRYHASLGYDVFEPMGFDAFGMHSENFALKSGTHPWRMVPRNIERFRETQLKRIGNRFDWSRQVDTTDPAYYRWTQWIFLQMYRHGLAYRGSADVNWCPKCRTVLADEQSAGGVCERCDAPVERRGMEQWFLRITRYAQRLLDGLDRLDWSESTKSAQRQWIGRSEGARIRFGVAGSSGGIEVFSTRPDTLWGATFVALAPGYPRLAELVADDRRTEVGRYVASARARAGGAAQSAAPKTGAFTGSYAVHPATGARVPIVVSDYVSTGYGTGAVMGVPAHDPRDFELARVLGIPVIRVVRRSDSSGGRAQEDDAYEGEGILADSGPFSGRRTEDARANVARWLSDRGAGGPEIQYRLHDWCVSRQRYWGTPIPMIWCDGCGVVAVPEDKLPVTLPYVEDYRPDGSGISPLARYEDFARTRCPDCGRVARRETDVCDNFLDSSWYYLRYPSTDSTARPFNPERTRRWLPVARYVGGNEHAVLHLMYSRFVTMALHDMGWLDFEEPFTTFRAHGLLVRDGAKMSKSKGNVVNPDEYLERHGADVLRMTLLFSGDFQVGGDFRDGAISGVERFVSKLWRYAAQADLDDECGGPDRLLSSAVRRVTADIERLHYNTAIAACMELLGSLRSGGVGSRRRFRTLLRLLEPFAPFVTHELWERIGGEGMLCDQPWPAAGADIPESADQEVDIVIQVDGKLRDVMAMRAGAAKEEVVSAALDRNKVSRAVGGRSIAGSVLVPDRLVNLVTS